MPVSGRYNTINVVFSSGLYLWRRVCMYASVWIWGWNVLTTQRLEDKKNHVLNPLTVQWMGKNNGRT